VCLLACSAPIDRHHVINKAAYTLFYTSIKNDVQLSCVCWLFSIFYFPNLFFREWESPYKRGFCYSHYYILKSIDWLISRTRVIGMDNTNWLRRFVSSKDALYKKLMLSKLCLHYGCILVSVSI